MMVVIIHAILSLDMFALEIHHFAIQLVETLNELLTKFVMMGQITG